MRMQEMEDRGDESRWFAVATPKGSNQKWKKMGHKLTLFYYLHPTEGARVQQVSVIIFTSQPLSQLLGNFSWSLVMVTWRCYGYITPKCHSLRSTTELLPVSAALTEAVHVPVLLETLPITFCFVVFIIFLRAEPLKKGSESRILRAIMKNAEQWILFPVDSWKGETGGLVLLLSFRMSHRLSIIWENMNFDLCICLVCHSFEKGYHAMCTHRGSLV